MKKLIGIVRIALALVSVVVMALMMIAVNTYSAYVSVGMVVCAFVLEALAIVLSFIATRKGLVLDICSIVLSIVACIIGFVEYSHMPGWSDLKLFAIVCIVFIVAPALDALLTLKKDNKKS